MGRETNSNFMNGVPELLILKLLGQGDSMAMILFSHP